MTALAAPRKDFETTGQLLGTDGFEAKASKVFYNSALVMKSAADGYLIPAATTANGRVMGWAELQQHPSLDTTGQADGFYSVPVVSGVGLVKNGTSTDACVKADEGKRVYVLDDQTVSRLPGANRPVAGILHKVRSSSLVEIYIPRCGMGSGNVLGDQLTAASEALSAAGAISAATLVTLLTLPTGAQAFTLPDGLFPGQTKIVTVVAIAGSPVGTITPATPSGFATVTALGAVGDSVMLIWTGAAWVLGPSFGVTFT